MSTMYQPMAGDMPPGLGPGGPPPGGGGGGASMAALAAALGAGGGAPPGDTPQPGDGMDPNAPDVSQMTATDHIRSAIKHLMMAMTETQDEAEGHGITKGLGALQGILASKAKASGIPSGS